MTAEVYTFMYHKLWESQSGISEQAVHVCHVDDTLWISVSDLLKAADIRMGHLVIDSIMERLPITVPMAKIPFHGPTYKRTVTCTNSLGAILVLQLLRQTPPRHAGEVQQWLLDKLLPQFLGDSVLNKPPIIKLPIDVPHEDAGLLSPKSVYILNKHPVISSSNDCGVSGVVDGAIQSNGSNT